MFLIQNMQLAAGNDPSEVSFDQVKNGQAFSLMFGDRSF